MSRSTSNEKLFIAFASIVVAIGATAHTGLEVWRQNLVKQGVTFQDIDLLSMHNFVSPLVTVLTATGTFGYWTLTAMLWDPQWRSRYVHYEIGFVDKLFIVAASFFIALLVMGKCEALAAPQDWEEQILNFVKLFWLFVIWDVTMLVFLPRSMNARNEVLRGLLGFNLPTIIGGLSVIYIINTVWNFYDMWTPVYANGYRDFVKPDIFLSGLLSFHLVFSGIGYLLLRAFSREP